MKIEEVNGAPTRFELPAETPARERFFIGFVVGLLSAPSQREALRALKAGEMAVTIDPQSGFPRLIDLRPGKN